MSKTILLPAIAMVIVVATLFYDGKGPWHTRFLPKKCEIFDDSLLVHWKFDRTAKQTVITADAIFEDGKTEAVRLSHIERMVFWLAPGNDRFDREYWIARSEPQGLRFVISRNCLDDFRYVVGDAVPIILY